MIYVKSYDEARFEAINLLSTYDCNIENLTIIHSPSKYGDWQVDYNTFKENESEEW